MKRFGRAFEHTGDFERTKWEKIGTAGICFVGLDFFFFLNTI